MLTLNAILDHLDICSEARQWAAAQPDAKTAWFNCPRGDWLLRGAVMLGIEHKTIVAATCDCAELALPYVPEGDERPQNAIDMTRAWLAGKATLEDVRAAADDAGEAAGEAIALAYDGDIWADAWATAADAAVAASAAADAASDADADIIATAARAAADAAMADGTHNDVLRQCADIVRSRITWEQIADRIEARCVST